MQALPEVAGIVREFGGEQDVGLGEAAVGDAKDGDAGARRDFRKEPRDSGDVLFEFLSLVRGFDGYRPREVKGNDKIEPLGGVYVQNSKQRKAEDEGRNFHD